MSTREVIPHFRAAHLATYAASLDDIGVPVDLALERYKLPVHLCEQPQTYLSLERGLEFLNCMAQSQGMEDLGLVAAERFNYKDLSTDVVTAIEGSSTLLEAMKRFSILGSQEASYINFWFRLNQSKALAGHSFTSATSVEGIRHAEWTQNMCWVHVIRAYAGGNWRPKTMTFTSKGRVGDYARRTFPDTEFRVGHSSAFIDVPQELLSLPVSFQSTPGKAADTSYKKGPFKSYSESIKELIKPYLRDGYPHIKLAAEINGTSVRSMQRRLAADCKTYSGLIKQARFEEATRLLLNSDIQILDLASELGWSDTASFSHAFKSIAGCNPSVYRQRHMNPK